MTEETSNSTPDSKPEALQTKRIKKEFNARAHLNKLLKNINAANVTPQEIEGVFPKIAKLSKKRQKQVLDVFEEDLAAGLKKISKNERFIDIATMLDEIDFIEIFMPRIAARARAEMESSPAALGIIHHVKIMYSMASNIYKLKGDEVALPIRLFIEEMQKIPDEKRNSVISTLDAYVNYTHRMESLQPSLPVAETAKPKKRASKPKNSSGQPKI